MELVRLLSQFIWRVVVALALFFYGVGRWFWYAALFVLRVVLTVLGATLSALGSLFRRRRKRQDQEEQQ